MKKFMKFGAIALAGALACAAMAGPVTGIWHGQLRVDASKLPAATDAKNKQMLMQRMTAIQNEKFTLTLKGDHTFALTIIGGPKGQHTVAGTWAQAGNKITITANRGGKADQPRTFVLSNDTKSFTLSQGPVTETFFR